MKKNLFPILTLLLILLFPLCVSAQVDQVVNGDFEAFESINGDWETFVFNEDDKGVVLDFIRESDNVYAKIGCEEVNYVSLRQSVFLRANTTYEIGADIKVKGVSTDGLGAYIRLEDNTGQTRQIKGTSDDWEHVAFFVTTLSTDVYTTIEIGIGDSLAPSYGTLYIDNVYIKESATVPVDAEYSLINSNQDQNTVQEPEVETIAPEIAPLLADNEKISILSILLCAVVFLVLITWFSSKSRPVVSKHPMQPPMPVIFLSLGFLVILFFKYVVASFGTDLSTDIGYFTAWSQSLVNDGLMNFYDHTYCNYPAGYMYVLYIVGLIGKVFSLPSGSFAYMLILKTPVIIAEVITALLVYRVGRKHIGERNALIFSMIVFLNPAILINTSAWCQIDAAFTLFIVLTFYLLEEKQIFWAAAAYGGAFLIKTQAILFIPVIGAYYLFLFLRDKEVMHNLKDFFISLLITFSVYVIFSIPFMGDNGIFWSFKQLISSANTYDYASLNGFGLLTLFGGNYTQYDQSFMLLSYQIWGFIFIVLSSLASMFLVLLNRNKQNLFLIAAFLLASVFTFGHGMHERYILPTSVILLFGYLYIRDRRVLNAAMLYTIFALLCQIVVLYFFGSAYYGVITIVLSLISLGCYGYLVYIIYIFAIKSGTVISTLDRKRPDEIRRRSNENTKKIVTQINEKLVKNLMVHEKRAAIDKTDKMMMLVMTLIYAAFAFVNLGSIKIPSNFWETETNNDQVIVTFENEAIVDQIKYYFGVGESDITVKGSVDGGFYYDVALPGAESESLIINHTQGQMFKWHFVDTGFESKYVQLTFSEPNLEVREICFFDSDGQSIPVESVALTDGTIITEMTDEASLAPDVISYMDGMYFDEIYHARTAYEQLNHDNVYEITHPPLGKTLMSVGIMIFGMNPFGWRFMGTLIGAMMLPIMYLFAKRLTKRTTFAFVATFLFMFDFMHFTQTRIATIDSYSVFYILLMFMFMYQYYEMNFHKDKLYQTFIPLGLCGLAFGLGAATKWLCLFAGAALALIFIFIMVQRYREYHAVKINLDNISEQHKPYYQHVVNTYYYKLVLTLLFCLIAFIVIPAIIYYLSYIPYTKIIDKPYDFNMILSNQKYMWNYHSHLDTSADPHPFASRWSTWLLDIRPMYFFQGKYYADDMISSLSSFGNPFVWWALFPALVIILIAKYNEYSFKGALGFTVVAGLSELAPWIFITRETYIYHYFATVPFMILIVTFACKYIWDKTKYGKFVILAYLVAVMALFIAFYPVITGVPWSREYVEGLRWLDSWPFY